MIVIRVRGSFRTFEFNSKASMMVTISQLIHFNRIIIDGYLQSTESDVASNVIGLLASGSNSLSIMVKVGDCLSDR